MSFWCGWHPERTPPDQNGVEICLRCGAAIEPPNILADIQNAMEMIWRQPHSMKCVRTDDNTYVCAKECPLYEGSGMD